MGSGCVCVKRRKIEIYISALADPDGGGVLTPLFFVRKLCQDKLKIAHFESGAPYENPNNSGNPHHS
jgi:hypothetical protein